MKSPAMSSRSPLRNKIPSHASGRNSSSSCTCLYAARRAGNASQPWPVNRGDLISTSEKRSDFFLQTMLLNTDAITSETKVNTRIYKELQIRSEILRKELEIPGIQDVRTKYEQNWINHLARTDNTGLPKHALNCKLRGQRDRGRPRKRRQRVDAGTGQTT